MPRSGRRTAAILVRAQSPAFILVRLTPLCESLFEPLFVPNPFTAADLVCPLCGRPIPKAQRDAHHLVPKSKGGRVTTYLHRICHRQIHAVLTETELARQYATVDALLAHPVIHTFVDWVKTKPDDFFVRTQKSARVKRR